MRLVMSPPPWTPRLRGLAKRLGRGTFMRAPGSTRGGRDPLVGLWCPDRCMSVSDDFSFIIQLYLTDMGD